MFAGSRGLTASGVSFCAVVSSDTFTTSALPAPAAEKLGACGAGAVAGSSIAPRQAVSVSAAPSATARRTCRARAGCRVIVRCTGRRDVLGGADIRPGAGLGKTSCDHREASEMRAIRVHAPGGAEVLKLEDVANPTPGAGEAVVRMEAIGVNFIEVYQRTGLYPQPLPFTPGAEGAGAVVAVGPDVSTVKVGDRVASETMRGTYAGLAVARAERLVALPNGVDTRTGAAVMLQGLTAHYLATSTYPLKEGDACLVHAGAGGVGLLLCQIAARRGARVIATVSTAEEERAG